MCVKGKFPDVTDDLVNSYHLLLACCDLMFANAVLADRRDILNPAFPGKRNFTLALLYEPACCGCMYRILIFKAFGQACFCTKLGVGMILDTEAVD